MTIEGLNKFLRDKYPHLFHIQSLDTFYFKRIAWDISSHIYKQIAIHGRDTYQWISFFINTLLIFKKYDIHIIPIFDGKAPPEKNEERKMRDDQRLKAIAKYNIINEELKEYQDTGTKGNNLIQVMKEITSKNHKKNNQSSLPRLLTLSSGKVTNSIPISTPEINDDIEINIDHINTYLCNKKHHNECKIIEKDIELIKELFNLFKISWFDAEGEAESTCAFLIKKGLIDAVFSIDSDCIAQQVAVWIRDINFKSEQCEVIYFNEVIKALELTEQQIVNLCILCGTDYNVHTKNIYSIGPVSALRHAKKYNSIDDMIENNIFVRKDKSNLDPEFGLNIKRNIELFNMNYSKLEKVNCWNAIDIDCDKIIKWINDKNLRISEDRLRRLWKEYRIQFID